LLRARRINRPSAPVRIAPSQHAYPALTLSYLGNVMNEKAASFYLDHGVGSIAPAYEKQRAEDAILMLCKHCLRYSMGGCARYGKGTFPYQEPLSLVTTAGKRFRLTFDCKNCQMRVSES
jgi:putative protease